MSDQSVTIALDTLIQAISAAQNIAQERFEHVVERLVSAVVEAVHSREQQSICTLQLERLGQDAASFRNAIYGHNGDKSGIVGELDVLENRVNTLEENHKELSKTLQGIAVAVILTLIGTILNLILR